MKYQIWTEGYDGVPDWGENWSAQLIGEIEADTFEQACDRFFVRPIDYVPGTDRTYYTKNNGKLWYWGMQLHDNEAGARKRNS